MKEEENAAEFSRENDGKLRKRPMLVDPAYISWLIVQEKEIKMTCLPTT